MPSDCQCSSSVSPSIVVRKVVLSDEESTRRLQNLEREVERLRVENETLSRKFKKANKTKKQIINELKEKLGSI